MGPIDRELAPAKTGTRSGRSEPPGRPVPRGLARFATSAHLAHGLYHFLVVVTVARLAAGTGPSMPAGLAIPLFFFALGVANLVAAQLRVSWRHRPFWIGYGLACLPMAAFLQPDLPGAVRIAATAAFLMPVHAFGIAFLVVERIEPPTVPLHSLYGVAGTLAGLIAVPALASSPLLWAVAGGTGAAIALCAGREPDVGFRQCRGAGARLGGRALLEAGLARAVAMSALHASILFALAARPISGAEIAAAAVAGSAAAGWQKVEAQGGAASLRVGAAALAGCLAFLVLILVTGFAPGRGSALLLFALATMSFTFVNALSIRSGPGTARQRLLAGIASNALAAAILAPIAASET